MILGNNPSLIDVKYIRANNKNGIKEHFQVIYMTEDGEVHYTKEEPLADIYIVKPEFRGKVPFYRPEELIKNMDKFTVNISDIPECIISNMGTKDKEKIKKGSKDIYDNEYRICISNGDKEWQAESKAKYRTKLFRYTEALLWPYAYGCDFQEEYYFMKRWYETYELKRPNLTKAFLDIEIDMIDYRCNLENINDTAYCPVNLVSLVFDKERECHSFILRPYKPNKGNVIGDYSSRMYKYQHQLKQHEDLMNNLEDFSKTLHDEFDATYGRLKYCIHEFIHEIDLIRALFKCINDKKPNFCMIWNMRFDILYLISRIKILGYDPEEIICHKDFSIKKCDFRIDKSTYKIEKQCDYFDCSSYTKYLCEMRIYASIRKSQHKLKSVKLNDIADRELRDKKVEYPPEADIVLFPYTDWKKFVIYNIKDSLLAWRIEDKTDDCLNYYMRSHSNLTPYNKIFRETHLLRNVREIYFEKDGWVQGNNIGLLREIRANGYRRTSRKDKEDEKETEDSNKVTFKGAINADPIMNDYVGENILGSVTNNIFMNATDQDMGSFYPSIKIASNMDPLTVIFKVSFINNEFETGKCINRSLNNKYYEKDKYGNIRELDITGEAINTYVSNNDLTFGYNYLNLPSISDLYKDIMNKINKE